MATTTAKDRILNSAIKLNLTGGGGTVNETPVLECDKFDAKPVITTVKHWPSGAGKERTQFTGISWTVTMDFGRRGTGVFPILKLLQTAVEAHHLVPTLRLTRYASTDYAGSFTETFINGTVTGGSMLHGKGNETASDTLVVDFESAE